MTGARQHFSALHAINREIEREIIKEALFFGIDRLYSIVLHNNSLDAAQKLGNLQGDYCVCIE